MLSQPDKILSNSKIEIKLLKATAQRGCKNYFNLSISFEFLAGKVSLLLINN